MITRAKKAISVFLAVAFLLPLLAGPLAAAPAANDPLGYYVYYMEDQGQFYFLGTNPSNQVVKLDFKTEREFELVVKKGNQVVWKYSDTKEWAKTPKQENFLPGHAKFYKVDVPKLPAGNYTLNAFFAGGPSQGSRVAQTQFSIGNKGWQPPVENSNELSYRLFQLDNQELMLVVQNTSSKPVKLRFPTAKEFDVIVFNSRWNKVWQDSWNHWYSPKGKTETLAPGQAKVYRTKLPKLSDGKYYAYGYFYGTPGNNAVASLSFTLDRRDSGGKSGINWDIANKLSFSAWYNGGKQPQIAFEVRNKTNQPVKISYPMSKAIKVVVKGDNGFSWSYGTGAALNTTTQIAAGGASYSFVYLPQLPKGNYTAEVYYHPYSTAKPAATTDFRVR
ncbi:MAG: hypothetical protein GX750_07720 [Clostridia bacterium]|nr:hypothetical protein [Clostridia bacterium]